VAWLLVLGCLLAVGASGLGRADAQETPRQEAQPGAETAPPAVTPLDAAALVRRALVENARDLKAMRNYIYLSDHTTETLDNDGHVKKTTSRRSEFFYLDGSPVERILQEDGQPLSETERARQEARIESEMADARSASPRHKEERERKAAKAMAEEMELRQDVVDGFNFTVAAEETRGGDRCVKLNAEPKPGFKGKSPLRALLPFLHGTLWIDADKGQWMEIDATPVKKVGGGIAYVNGDSEIHLHQEPVADGLWVMTGEEIRGDMRLLWDRKNVHVVRKLSGFRKFSTSMRILPVESGTVAPAANPQ
jgi:hypothetical protein